MNKSILIIGGGGHAKVIASLLKKHSDWSPIGYLDVIDRGSLLGLPYLGSDDLLLDMVIEHVVNHAVIGIGQINNVESRKFVVNTNKESGIIFPPIISETAIINEDVKLDEGCVVMDGAIIQPGSAIGKFSIINTGAIIDHDCQLGDNVHVAPGAHLSGDIQVGTNVLIGVGANIIQGIIITDDVVVGAGAVVTRNITEAGTYTGIPANRLTIKN